jgi:cobyrinic acid a,c-diamide synthase
LGPHSRQFEMTAKAIVIAAPQSGSGKTVVTLGLLRALRNRGFRVASAKAGPDYIDPRFHELATGRSCFNLDPWAMSGAQIAHYQAQLARDADIVIVEGVMGLFDRPVGAVGSTDDLARELGYPIILVVDCSRMAQSVGALVNGLFMGAFSIGGVILNRVASQRHERSLREGLGDYHGIFGVIYRDETLSIPSRHLGLVQAAEHAGIEAFLERAAAIVESSLDVDALLREFAEVLTPAVSTKPLAPLGQRVAIANDEAFAFSYPHLLHDWRGQGAEILQFSPLADEKPAAAADAVFLPGGYPELHTGKIAASSTFLDGLRAAHAQGKTIYGECGGFMVLGEYLIDRNGERHRMAGLLPLGTSFAKRKLMLGYRHLKPIWDEPWRQPLRGHEFHYSTVDWQGDAEPLFEASDAQEQFIGKIGLKRERTMGSYAHVIA